MRRYLPRLVLTGALLSPATLYALGLGEIRLNSALNQPFDAEIELIAPTAEELASLKVGLANNDLFARYGLDRPAFLSNFDFSVTRGRDGRAAIKVTSNRSVTEPFVTLLVEANWGRGRLLREYTVLLDPPVFMPTQPETQAPIAAPQSGAQTEGRIERAPEPAPAPQQRSVPSPAEPVVREAPPASAEALAGSYTVQRNDTLWRIASSVAPGSSRRVINQTMIALFRANPQAFDGNINLLKAGSVLRIPDRAEIESISLAEAAAEVSRQQQEWSGAPRSAASEETSRLRLVPPEEAPTASAPATPDRTESAASTQAGRGTAEPRAEDRRLEVNSPELAAAQQSVSEAPVTPDANQEAAEQSAEPVADQTQDAEASQAETAAAQPQRRPVRKPAPAPQPEEPSLLDRLISFWWIPVLLGLLGIGALAFLKRRREQSDLSELEETGTFRYEPEVDRPALKPRDQAESFAREDASAADDSGEFDARAVARDEAPAMRSIAAFEPEAPAISKVDDTLSSTLSSETQVRFDQQDALAEADFHMAYGLYDQAADLVKIAIDREPERRDLKLKLLEIYFVWGNKDLFLDTARELHATVDQAPAGEWDKVLIMGKQIAPEDAMFQGETGGHVDLVDVNLEGGENHVDVDLFAEPADVGDEPAGLDLQFTSGEHLSLDTTTKTGESDLDFLLSDDQPSRDDEPTREMDHLSRTQETPTIESPMLDRSAAAGDETVLAKIGTDQTAEVSLDDLGLDVDSLEATGSLEDTAALQKDPDATQLARPVIGDDEMTQLAPSLGSLDPTMEAPRRVETFDIESTGTIYVDQVDLSGGDTVEQRRPDVDSTASLQRISDVDVDFGEFAEEQEQPEETNQTIRHPGGGDLDAMKFSDDVFGTDKTATFQKVDWDVGEPLASDDHEPTNKVLTTEMELSELEPVTMSEVGTKLDLARAYMDMGDPDGARSILEEVVQEGNASQKQEAMRLLDSIR
jgi:pilus assembly protein FimV